MKYIDAIVTAILGLLGYRSGEQVVGNDQLTSGISQDYLDAYPTDEEREAQYAEMQPNAYETPFAHDLASSDSLTGWMNALWSNDRSYDTGNYQYEKQLAQKDQPYSVSVASSKADTVLVLGLVALIGWFLWRKA
jgi:hypothetical protein